MFGRSLITASLLPWQVLASSFQMVPKFPQPDVQDLWSVTLDEDGRASLWRGKISPRGSEALAAWGSFYDAINSTGWAVLDLHSSPDLDGDAQSYAAGYLEGALTHPRITQHLSNMWGIDFKGVAAGTIPASVRTFIAKNMHWMKENVKAYAKQDIYWRTVGHMLEQLRGLTDGFNTHRKVGKEHFISESEMLVLTMVDTDMDNIVVALDAQARFEHEHFRRHRRHHGHCSAVVQVCPELSDIWLAHASWDSYRAMLRMIKYLDLPLPGVAARRMAFSANPANLYSADDFYVVDTGLAITETTIDNHNTSLWAYVRPDTLMNWARSMVSNRLARTGDEWTELQLRYQSGTCNNQWMVVDRNKFSPGKPLLDGTLWVSETMPGHSHRADVTDVLRQRGFWPSYNIPYFKDIWEVGGWKAMQELHPEKAQSYSYSQDARALMFQRASEAAELTNLSSLMKVIRYNRPKDPLADGDACNGISARCDLNPHSDRSYDCFGAVDAKIVGWSPKDGDLSFIAVASPSWEATHETPFSWSKQDVTIEGCKPEQHAGHPDTFNFTWQYLPSSWAHPHSVGVLVMAAEGQTKSTLRPTWPSSFGMQSPTLCAMLSASVVVAYIGLRFRRHVPSERPPMDYILIEE